MTRDEQIKEHIRTARELTPTETSVRQKAFEQLIQAIELIYLDLKRRI